MRDHPINRACPLTRVVGEVAERKGTTGRGIGIVLLLNRIRGAHGKMNAGEIIRGGAVK